MTKTPIFDQVEHTSLPTNIFDLTHDRKLSCKMGNLVPIMTMDCIPGDKIKVQSSAMVRFQPMIAPFMHRVNVTIHHFFVPNRILWDGWENFITGGPDGLDTSVPPYFEEELQTLTRGSLADYMGLPVDTDVVAGAEARQFSAFPFAAYLAIYNDYYRDQNLIPEVNTDLTDGANTYLPFSNLQFRAWQNDYFTSALPFTQRGPEATIPIVGEAQVVADSDNITIGANYPVLRVITTDALAPGGADVRTGAPPTSGPFGSINTQVGSTYTQTYLDPNGSLFADLSTATAAGIIDLRRAVRLQEFLEKSARGGSRYIESMQVHFGVISSDKRLQRPEYIGGSMTPIKVSEVLQTSSTDPTSPQGTMAGHAVSVGGGKSYGYEVEEHGYIISIMSITPESAYQQGIPRHYLRKDRYDYYWPDFAHIGEQAIMNDELVVEGTVDDGEDVWGYTPRYAEYKFINNTVHGDFKSSLDFWHLGRKFDTLPNLNAAFSIMRPEDVDRIFAVQDGTDNLLCQVINNVSARRKMPVFGTPKL